MNGVSSYMEHYKFQQENKVVSTDLHVKKNSTYIPEEDVTLNNDEPTETVTRQVEGKLAQDMRKRVKAGADEPVFITEQDGVYWLSELTAENTYRMTVRCNGVEKSFALMSASHNFQALLDWLDEDPETPIGDDVEE